MPTVGIVGAGRVGCALARALVSSGIPVHSIASGRPEHGRLLATEVGATYCSPLDVLTRTDLAVLAVPDAAIALVAADLAAQLDTQSPEAPRGHSGQTARAAGETTSPDCERQAGSSPRAPRRPWGDRAVVHCSGALDSGPLNALVERGWAAGAWHPLQAFATDTTDLAHGVTWAVTADEPLATTLDDLTRRLGGRPFRLAADDKARYHAAAALASNYTVTLASHAAQLLVDCGLGPDEATVALVTLLRSTLDGVDAHGLPAGLTGPMVRGDVETVRRHLDALAAYPQTDALYRALGEATLPLVAARGAGQATLEALAEALRSRPRGYDDTPGSAGRDVPQTSPPEGAPCG